MISVERLDHLVLTVANIDATINFYQTVLGMVPITFGTGRKALSFGQQKINLHQLGNEFEPKAEKPVAGSADLCFTTQTPLTQLVAHLQTKQIKIVDGPVPRTGARAALQSVYFRDPDGNLIEVSNEIGSL